MVYDPRQDSRYNTDKLFLSLLKQESRFNPNAVSPTGARGYAQVLPSTASDPGFGLKANPNAVKDPEQNVKFGYDYFNMLKKRYNGDTAAALVGYNGGPGAADKWIASGKDDKVISKESRNYYKTILSDTGNNIKPAVKVPEDENYEPQFDKVMRNKTKPPVEEKTNVRSTEEAASTAEPSAISVAGNGSSDSSDSSTDSDTTKKRVRTNTSSTSSDTDTETVDNTDTSSFSKVIRPLQLQSFGSSAPFTPIPLRLSMTRDDPRNR